MVFNDSQGILGLGYYFGGPVLHASMEKYFELGNKFQLSFEGKVTPSYSIFPVYNGKAYLWNLCIQFTAGMGFVPIKKLKQKI
jgi:hypothetical protein